MRVFVLSQKGIPLMPTTPRRARLWLKTRRAKVVRYEPFTIQLQFETTSYTQSVTVGVDTGSKTVGIAAISNGEVLLQAEVHLRTDTSEKMTQRHAYRSARRSRKTRYRAPRYANRTHKAGWLPPSLSQPTGNERFFSLSIQSFRNAPCIPTLKSEGLIARFDKRRALAL